MRFVALLFSMILGGAALAFAVSPAVHAGSCTFPVTELSWTGQINSGVHMRDKTCMDSNIVHTVPGGSVVSIIGEADGWYLIAVDGTQGYVWHTFVTITDKTSNINHKLSDEYTGGEDLTEVKEQVVTETKQVVSKETSTQVSDRLKGRILLQVEQNGEAWYVHPDDGKRFYMKDGETAYQMMREFGLGITDADLAKLQAGDPVLIAQLKGKILLQVEQHGEAFYIHPETGQAHYLKDGAEAYRIMRELSLGITDADLNKITADDFDVYKAEKEVLRKASENTIESSINGSIKLSAEVIEGKVKLTWSLSGVDTSKGFKVLYSTFPNPSYPNDNPQYLSDGSTRSHSVWMSDTGYYHFRICQYTGNGCGLYSNNIGIFVENSDAVAGQGQITLTASVVSLANVDSSGAGKVMLSWGVDGVDVGQGFKVVKSTSPNPVYPGDDYHYLSDASKRSDTWTGLAAGVYHFRVCQYLGGKCGVYSNDVSVTVEAASSSTTVQAGEVPTGVDLTELNNYWLDKINTLRAQKGLRLLVLDQRWNNTATEWAAYMGVNDAATHNRPDGKSMHQWIDTKGLDFTTRYSEGGWASNYFTENIAWGYAGDGTTVSTKKILDDTLAFFLAEESYNGDHYRTIYHADWNSVGLGFHFAPNGSGGYKVYVAMHYGSLNL